MTYNYILCNLYTFPSWKVFWGTSWAKWQIKENCHNSSGGGTWVWRIEAGLQSDSDGTVPWSFKTRKKKQLIELCTSWWIILSMEPPCSLILTCLMLFFTSVCLYDGTFLAGCPIVAHKKCIPVRGLRPLLQVHSSQSPWSWVQYGQCQVIAKPQMQAGEMWKALEKHLETFRCETCGFHSFGVINGILQLRQAVVVLCAPIPLQFQGVESSNHEVLRYWRAVEIITPCMVFLSVGDLMLVAGDKSLQLCLLP